MTPLRFRAWDNKDKLMLPVHEIRFAGPNDNLEANEVVIIPPMTDGIIVGVDTEAIIMQSTGLKDKNEKEIFEGDIVKVWFGESYEDSESDYIAEMKWNDEYGYWDAGAGPYNATGYEIIGNIYENSELLS